MSKNAIITGGSRGIGKAMALKLGELGYNVAINYRSDSSKQLTEDLVEEIKSEYGVEAIAVQADVSVFEDCKKLVEATVEAFGEEIDALVNNAGITNNCNFIDLQPEDYERVINTNLVSMMHMCHLTLPYMVDRETSIVCTASVGGLTGVINQADYCAAKTGVIGLCRALALEFAPRKVRVNAIAPGFIETDMTNALSDEVRNEWAKQIPLRRGGSAREVADVAMFLASDISTYITGQVINVCGGMNT